MLEELDDDYALDRTFLNLSSGLADIFANTYGKLGYRLIAPLDQSKFDNQDTITEIAIRAMIVIGAVASAFLAGSFILVTATFLSVGSSLFRAVGFYFQKDGFTHIRGSAPEQSLIAGQAKVMTWNIRGHGGGLHYAAGGVIHWESRIDGIFKNIKNEKPNIIVLQEVYDIALVEALVSKLGGDYAHFFAHLGSNSWSSDSGCLVIANCSVHKFKNIDFEKSDSKVRGFQIFEIKANPDDLNPCARIIGTQLSPGKKSIETRKEQISQIVNSLAKEKMNLPTLFVGNLCFDRDHSEEGKILSKYLYHSYLDVEPTHSDKLKNQWAPIYDGQEESSDFISFFKRSTPNGQIMPVIEKGIRLVDSHLIKAFDQDYNTKTALSDHQPVVTTFSGLRSF